MRSFRQEFFGIGYRPPYFRNSFIREGCVAVRPPDSGKVYNAVNIAHSMLSVTLRPIDGITIGSHPLVVKIMKGCNPFSANELLIIFAAIATTFFLCLPNDATPN